MVFVAALAGVLSYAIWAWATAEVDDPKAIRSGPFLATPYLQLGESPRIDDLTLLWHADDVDARWSVEFQSPEGTDWRAAEAPTHRRIILDDVEHHRVYRSVMPGLEPGEPFRYRVKLDEKSAFEAEARAKVPPGMPHRFVAFGDSSKKSVGQRKVAYQTHLLKPDMVLITGDIVYFQGRVGEYRPKFFPIYASNLASPRIGAPLLKSTLFVGVPGNHDLMVNDFSRNADLMAYYYFWSQPLNGPIQGARNKLTPPLVGPEVRLKAFRQAAGPNYPRMANFSFDYGDVHWTVLDANPYVQWADPELRGWVAADLLKAKDKPWKFVTFHHPGFNSSNAHSKEQQMRLLADIFEAGGVSLVLSGHVHNYQRTYPLKFAATTYPDGHAPEPSTPVDGKITIDHAYDGTAKTRPNGVIYLVTGAGGADLYDEDQTDAESTWQPFTTKFIANIHSLTVVDIDSKTATVRQIDADGKELDRFVIARPISDSAR
jgi:3',5'-cyclic AMP phosphodiesterase CpdA